jgi:lysophospholipase L1-like esterase
MNSIGQRVFVVMGVSNGPSSWVSAATPSRRRGPRRRHPRSRSIYSVLAPLLLAAAVGVVSVVPATANVRPPTASAHFKSSPYVAVGDSYSSAAGVHPQVPGAPGTCSRSLLNYAHVIADVTDPKSFTDVTCAGAKTSDLFSPQAPGVAPQLDAVTKKTRLVTMTIGGNDADAFGRILNGCVTASLMSGSIFGDPCQQEFGSTFTDLVTSETYPNLVEALTAIRDKAPHATVVILGYPRVMPDIGDPACYPAMPISMGDVPYVNDWARALNDTIEKAASETGAHYIDMWPASADRDACQPASRRWIEPLNGAINADSVHPNSAGQAAMAAVTLNQLRIGDT